MLFERADAETYMRIMRPKIHGVWNLHSCLTSHPLDFFVNLSSAAGTYGNRGQAAYAATSTALGAFARWRTAQNMPTVTIHLGLVSDVGYVAERKGLMEAMRRDFASAAISEPEIHALVMTAIEGRASEPEIYTGFALERVSPELYWIWDAKFSHLRRSIAQDTHYDTPAGVSLSRLLKKAGSMEAARQLMVEGLVQKVCSLLMISPEDIDISKPVAALGLDSLVAVELRNWIVREMEVSINLVEVMTASSLGALAKLAGQRSRLVDWEGFGEKNDVLSLPS
jgi:acyl carrier protein